MPVPLLSTVPPDSTAAVAGGLGMQPYGPGPYPSNSFYPTSPVYTSGPIVHSPMPTPQGANLPRLLGAPRTPHEITEAAKGAQRAAAVIAACLATPPPTPAKTQGHMPTTPASVISEAVDAGKPRVVQLEKALATAATAPPTPQGAVVAVQQVAVPVQNPIATALVPGSPELPTVGSALHGSGGCKPCAFVFKEPDGCQNGVDCRFCHLCEQGEKKKRKKERKEMLRAAKQWGC